MTKNYKLISDNLVRSLKNYVLLRYNKLLSIFTLLKKHEIKKVTILEIKV